jgi:hypothetical protein
MRRDDEIYTRVLERQTLLGLGSLETPRNVPRFTGLAQRVSSGSR